MTTPSRIERSLPSILSDLAAGPMPEYIDDVLAATGQRRQRPAWTFPERWHPMADIAERTSLAPTPPWRLIAAALVILALIAGAVVAYVGSRPRVPAPFGLAANGLVVFHARGDTWVIDPKTGERRVLVQDPVEDYGAEFSLDGTRLAILSLADGGGNRIRVTSADGTEAPTWLAPDPFVNLHAWPWSPRGDALAAIHEVDGTHVLSIVPADGGPIRTMDLDGLIPSDPSWRPPDGRELLFRGERNGELDLYVIGADGTGLRPLHAFGHGGAPGPDHLRGPAWSPNGSQVAYMEVELVPGADEPRLRVHVINADGTDDHEIPSPDGVSDSWPVWSPAGNDLLVMRSAGRRAWPAIIDAAGTDPGVDLDRGASWVATDPWDLRWSPDATQVLAADLNGRRALRLDPVTGAQVGDPWSDMDWPAWQRAPSR